MLSRLWTLTWDMITTLKPHKIDKLVRMSHIKSYRILFWSLPWLMTFILFYFYPMDKHFLWNIELNKLLICANNDIDPYNLHTSNSCIRVIGWIKCSKQNKVPSFLMLILYRNTKNGTEKKNMSTTALGLHREIYCIWILSVVYSFLFLTTSKITRACDINNVSLNDCQSFFKGTLISSPFGECHKWYTWVNLLKVSHWHRCM